MASATVRDLDDVPALMTKADLEALTGLSHVTIYQLLQQAGFPAYKIGTRWRIPKQEFLAWLAQQKDEGSRE